MSWQILSAAGLWSWVPSGPFVTRPFERSFVDGLPRLIFLRRISIIVYFSLMSDPQSAGTDAMMQSWDGLQAYAFPLFGLLLRVFSKVRHSKGLELTLVAPFWPQHPWFPHLLELLVDLPFFLPLRKDLLKQPHFHRFHQNLPVLRLTAYRLSSDLRDTSGSLREWLLNLPAAEDLPH